MNVDITCMGGPSWTPPPPPIIHYFQELVIDLLYTGQRALLQCMDPFNIPVAVLWVPTQSLDTTLVKNARE